MIAYLLGTILATSALCLPAWWIAQKRMTWFIWDYATVSVPLALWFILAGSGYGALSLGNLFEPIALVVSIPLLMALRLLVLDQVTRSPRNASIAVFAICVVAALGLRTFTPPLYE